MYIRVFGCSTAEVNSLEKIYNNSKTGTKQAGLSFEEFTKAIKLDKFWTQRLFTIMSDECVKANRISLAQFIYLCILLKPVQSERILT